MLVSDDYKMTTSAARIHMLHAACPLSTWLHRMADRTPEGSVRKHLRGMSRKVRQEEMRYAISRAVQYDVQSKLTWLIDSLLSTPRRAETQRRATPEADDGVEERQVQALRRHLRGGRVKSAALSELGPLVDACAPAGELMERMQALSTQMREDGTATARRDLEAASIEAQEMLAVGLAPLDEEQGHLAMAALTPLLCEVETTLGILAQMMGEVAAAHRHLAMAGLLASIIDDDAAEVSVLFLIGLLAMHQGDHAKASRLLRAAAVEASKVPAWELEGTLAAGIAAQPSDAVAVAEHLIARARNSSAAASRMRSSSWRNSLRRSSPLVCRSAPWRSTVKHSSAP